MGFLELMFINSIFFSILIQFHKKLVIFNWVWEFSRQKSGIIFPGSW